MMQAKLELSEFAYLLHTLKASQVVGVDSALFFPDDELIRESLLRTGLETLRTHGWMVPQGLGWQINTRLVLMVAVVATPEIIVTMTQSTPAGRQQIVTYYLAQSIYIEQFRTADDQYLLTELDTETDFVGRLQAAFQIPAATPWSAPISLPTSALTEAVNLARSGDSAFILSLLEEFGGEQSGLADLLVSLRPVGDLEFATLQGNQVIELRDAVILEGTDGSKWAMSHNQESGEVTFHPLNMERFSAFVLSRMSQLSWES